MPIANVGDADLHYEEHGTGEPLLLISGLNGSATWGSQIAPFSKRFRTIVHDQRGSGKSTKSVISYSVAQIGRDTLGLMDHLGIGRAHILGHSLGAAAAQWIAVEHPDRISSLVLASAWSRPDEYLRRTMLARKNILLDSGVAAYTNSSAIFMYPPEWIEAHRAELKEGDVRGVAAFAGVEIMSSRIDAVLEFDSSAWLPRIKVPTLVIVAADDILTPPYMSEYLASRIESASLAILKHGAHRFSHVKPDDFNGRVLAFLEKLGR